MASLNINTIIEEIEGEFQYGCEKRAHIMLSQFHMFAEDAFYIDPVTGCINCYALDKDETIIIEGDF